MAPEQKKPETANTTTERKQPTASKNTTVSASSNSPSTDKGKTPRWRDALHAASHNDTAAVESFLQKNEELIHETDEDEKTIAHIAVENGNLPLLRYIFERYGSLVLFKPDHVGNTLLQRAIEKNGLPAVKYLVDECDWNVSKPNEMSHSRDTPIHVAAAQGRLEILKYFIEQKEGDPNIRNGLGDPPAFLAAEKSRLNVIKYLHEERGADMMALNDHQCSILHICAMSGDLAVTKYLLDEKKLPFDVNGRDVMNWTLVYTATRYAKFEFVKYIVGQHQADPNIPDELGRTPLHAAAYQNNYPICEFLVNNGADLEARDTYNCVPSEEATQSQLIEFLKHLRKERAEQAKRVRRDVSLAPLRGRFLQRISDKGSPYGVYAKNKSIINIISKVITAAEEEVRHICPPPERGDGNCGSKIR